MLFPKKPFFQLTILGWIADLILEQLDIFTMVFSNPSLPIVVRRRGPSVLPSEEAEEKSRACLEVEPLFAQGRIEILDHPQLMRELKMLERRPRAGGKIIVDHPHGGRDDYANALALAAAKSMRSLCQALRSQEPYYGCGFTQ